MPLRSGRIGSTQPLCSTQPVLLQMEEKDSCVWASCCKQIKPCLATQTLHLLTLACSWWAGWARGVLLLLLPGLLLLLLPLKKVRGCSWVAAMAHKGNRTPMVEEAACSHCAWRGMPTPVCSALEITSGASTARDFCDQKEDKELGGFWGERCKPGQNSRWSGRVQKGGQPHCGKKALFAKQVGAGR